MIKRIIFQHNRDPTIVFIITLFLYIHKNDLYAISDFINYKYYLDVPVVSPFSGSYMIKSYFSAELISITTFVLSHDVCSSLQYFLSYC